MNTIYQTRTADSIRQTLELENAINRSTSDEDKNKQMEIYKRERRLKNVKRYLKERAAR